jgi:hypothetical protein
MQQWLSELATESYGTVTVVVFFTIASYRSTATIVTVRVPAATFTLALIWSLNACVSFVPSTHSSRRFTPFGELPLAFTVSAFVAGVIEQIAMETVWLPGAGQFGAAFVFS